MMISFGAMSTPLKDQFKMYGKVFDEKEVEMLQKMSDYVAYLKIHGILTDVDSRNARKRIVKRINKLESI